MISGPLPCGDVVETNSIHFGVLMFQGGDAANAQPAAKARRSTWVVIFKGYRAKTERGVRGGEVKRWK